MLTKMSMTNFKSWAETGDIRLAPLTAFFGTNSSGKSSLLQMLLLLKQTVESSDRGLVLKTGSQRDGYVNLGTAYEMTHHHAQALQFGLEWDFAEADHIQINEHLKLDKLEFATHIAVAPTEVEVQSITYRHTDLFRVALEREPQTESYRFEVKIKGAKAKQVKGRPSVGMKPNKCYGFSDEAMNYYQQSEYLQDVILRFEQQFGRLHYLGPLREYPERTYSWGGERPENVDRKGELTVSALLAAEKQKLAVYPNPKGNSTTLQQRVAQWLRDLDLAHSFEVTPLVKGGTLYEVRLKRNADSPEVPLTDVGIGVSQILPVLVLCYYVPTGSTIILEQPELHLHPSVQSSLADVLIDVVKNRGVQIIVESHSEHLLRRLQRRIAEQTIPSTDVAVYFSDLHEGASRLTALELDAFGAIRNYPRGFFGDMIGDVVATMEASLNAQE